MALERTSRCAHNPYRRFAALIAAATLASPAHAQDGAYDPSFGSVGRTWFDVTSSTSDNGTRLILLPRGNFFMAGACGENHIACAIWLTASGTLAAGFGTAGSGKIMFSDFAGWPADANEPADAAAFANGRVALAGYKSGGSYLAMLRADGTGLDPAVGNGAGYVSPSFTVAQVRVTAQQQLIVVGQVQASPDVIVVARYDSTLHLDTSFGSGGSTTIGFTGADVSPYGMTLQRDGKIVVIGTVYRSPRATAIVRLTAGGNPDPDFGINSDGRYESSYGTTYGTGGSDIAQDKKGRLVFSGYTRTDDTYGGKWLVNRVLSGGAVETLTPASGLLVRDQSVPTWVAAIASLRDRSFAATACRASAERFAAAIFDARMAALADELLASSAEAAQRIGSGAQRLEQSKSSQ